MRKLLINHYYTKRCTYGNVYHVCQIKNLRTNKSFSVSTPSIGNVEHILRDAGFSFENIESTDICTNSARTSSLPNSEYFNSCQYTKEWAKALRSIGFKVKAVAK